MISPAQRETRDVRRVGRPMILLSLPFGVLMFVNGVGHIAGSFAMGRLTPGRLSAPLLLMASGWLLAVAHGSGARGQAGDVNTGIPS